MIKPYLEQLEGFKTEALGKHIFSNGGIPLVPVNPRRSNPYLYSDPKVMNLLTFELPNKPIRFVKALSKGWCAVVAHDSVAFLRPDMDAHADTYSIANIDSLSEYQVKPGTKEEVHLLALLSTTMVEVLLVRGQYASLRRLYNLTFLNNVELTHTLVFRDNF